MTSPCGRNSGATAKTGAERGDPAEENQRQIISKELHDGLGPLLSSVRMSVSALSTQSLNDTQKRFWRHGVCHQRGGQS
ncbi:histidine kinase [Rikenella microfusus]|uniref:histidine kinase n=1 Tax=Rikenella microfusus TaxID=28139 RepID=UPI000E1B57DC